MTPLIETPVREIDDEREQRDLERSWRNKPGLLEWFSVTTHQAIGKRYIVTAFIFLLVGVWTRACANDRCPSISSLNGSNGDQSSKIFASDGRLIGDYGQTRRTVINLKAMSPAVPAIPAP